MGAGNGASTSHDSSLKHAYTLTKEHLEQGRHEEAKKLCESVATKLVQEFGPEIQEAAIRGAMDAMRKVTKEVYLDRGRYKEAVEWGKHVVTICKQTLGPRHRETAMAITGLAKAHMKLGEFKEAGQLYQEALPICEEVFKPDSDWTKEVEKYSYLGQELGGYRLVKCLGEGGFACVYLGEYKQPSTQDGQDSQLPRQAAVKVLQKRRRNPKSAEAIFRRSRDAIPD